MKGAALISAGAVCLQERLCTRSDVAYIHVLALVVVRAVRPPEHPTTPLGLLPD